MQWIRPLEQVTRGVMRLLRYLKRTGYSRLNAILDFLVYQRMNQL